MLTPRHDIEIKGRNQSTWCFEGFRCMLSTSIYAPDGFKTSQIMQGDIGKPKS